MEDYISSLPHERILDIAYQLDAEDIVNLCASSNSFRFIWNDVDFWSQIAKVDLKFQSNHFKSLVGDMYSPDLYFQIKNLSLNPSGNFYKAIYEGDAGAVDILLEYVDPSVNNNYAIRWTSARGHLDVVNRLLMDPRVASLWTVPLCGSFSLW